MNLCVCSYLGPGRLFTKVVPFFFVIVLKSRLPPKQQRLAVSWLHLTLRFSNELCVFGLQAFLCSCTLPGSLASAFQILLQSQN